MSALGTAATSFFVNDGGTVKTRTATQVLSDIGATAVGTIVDSARDAGKWAGHGVPTGNGWLSVNGSTWALTTPSYADVGAAPAFSVSTYTVLESGAGGNTIGSTQITDNGTTTTIGDSLFLSGHGIKTAQYFTGLGIYAPLIDSINCHTTVVQKNGNVGVLGSALTASIPEALYVNGNVRIIGSGTNALQFENGLAGTRFHYIVPHYDASVDASNYLEFQATTHTPGAQVSVMYLNGAGNVGIGCTPRYLLHLYEAAATHSPTSGTGALCVQNYNNTYGNNASILFETHEGTDNRRAQITAGMDGASGGAKGFLSFTTRNSGGSFVEALRINSSQQVGIGCTPSALLDVSGIARATIFDDSGYTYYSKVQTVTMSGDQTVNPAATRIELVGSHIASISGGSLPIGSIVYVTEGPSPSYPQVNNGNGGATYSLDANSGVTYFRDQSGIWVCVGHN